MLFPQTAVQDTPRNEVPADITGGYRSPDMQTVTESQYNYTVDNFPQISSNDFTRYVQALIKLLVGEGALQEWITKGRRCDRFIIWECLLVPTYVFLPSDFNI